MNAQFNGRDQPIGLVQIEGHLAHWTWGVPLDVDPTGWVAKVILTQNYDYLDSSPGPDEGEEGIPFDQVFGYRYGGQSVGTGAAVSFPLGKLHVDAQAEGNFVPIGAVNSLYSQSTGIISERFREYDFGIGMGFRAKANVLWHGWGRLSTSYAHTWLDTQDGSNVCGGDEPPNPLPVGVCNKSEHRISVWTVNLKLELDKIFELITNYPATGAENFWIGGDYLWFKKDSRYSAVEFLDELNSTNQWRIMISWDVTR